jgi:hypothetical protein
MIMYERASPADLMLVRSSDCMNQNKLSQSQSHIVTDSQSISKSWCWAPSGALDPIFITLWQLRLFLGGGGAISDERMGLTFVYAAGPCQRTVSDLRLPFSSSPTIRSVTAEVFEPASTREIKTIYEK